MYRHVLKQKVVLGFRLTSTTIQSAKFTFTTSTTRRFWTWATVGEVRLRTTLGLLILPMGTNFSARVFSARLFPLPTTRVLLPPSIPPFPPLSFLRATLPTHPQFNLVTPLRPILPWAPVSILPLNLLPPLLSYLQTLRVFLQVWILLHVRQIVPLWCLQTSPASFPPVHLPLHLRLIRR